MELNDQLAQLPSANIADAIAVEQQRLAELNNVGEMKLQASELRQRSATIRKLVNRVGNTQAVPPWIDRIFTAFGVGGFIVFVMGLLVWAFGGRNVSSLHGALAGSAFGSAGLMWFFFRIGLKNHFDSQAGVRLDDLQSEALETETKLARGSWATEFGHSKHAGFAGRAGRDSGRRADQAVRSSDCRIRTP